MRRYNKSFLGGYNQIRKLDENEIKSFLWLLRGAAFRILSTRLIDGFSLGQRGIVRHKDLEEFYVILQYFMGNEELSAI